MKSTKNNTENVLDALEACTRAIASLDEPRSVIKAIAEQVARVMDVEDCSVIMLEDDQTARVVVSTESPDREDEIIHIKDYPEILSVMETGDPLVIDDVKKSELLKEVTGTPSGKHIRSLVLLPGSMGGQLLGILILRFSIKGNPLTQAPLQFLKAVANSLVLALRNMRYKDRVLSEVTEKKEALKIAKQEEKYRQRYQELFHRASDGLIVMDSWGKVLTVNKKFEGLTGFTEEEVKEYNYLDLVTDEFREEASRFVMEYRRKPALRRSRFDIKTKRDGIRHVLASVEPLSGPEEQALVSLQDITEEKELEHQLRRTKEFLENLIQSSVDAVVACDMEGTIMIFNEAAEKISGYRADEVIGKLNIVDFYTPGAARDVMRKLRSPDYGGKGKLETTHYTMLSCDGEEIPLNVSAAIVYEEGKEIASVGIFHDLRERIRIEKDLRAAQKDLVESEKQSALAQLSGAAAHELNQPLTSIMGYSELMMKRIPEGDENRKAIETIVQETERMAGIVKKIGRISSYHIKDYVGREQILDLDKSSFPGSRYENLFLSMRDGLLEFSIDENGNIGECVFANPSAVMLFGLGNAYELLGVKLDALIVDTEAISSFTKELKERGFFQGKILDARRTDGAGLCIEVAAYLLEGEGAGDMVELLVRDVTTRVEMENELRRLKEFNENIVNNAPVGIAVVDSAGVVTSVNDRSVEIMGASDKSEMIGRNLFELSASKNIDISTSLRKGFKGQRVSLPHLEYMTLAGRKLDLRVEGMPLFDNDNNIIGGVIIYQDISEEKRAQLELEVINEISRAATKGISTRHLYKVLTKQLKRLLEFDVLSVVLRENDGNETIYEILNPYRKGPKWPREGPFDLAGSMTEKIINERTSRRENDLSAAMNLPSDDLMIMKSGFRSIMNVPLVSRDWCMGTLNMGSVNPEVYTDEDLHFFRHVADEFAMAMENIKLVNELTRKNVELEQKSLYLETLLRVGRGFRVTMHETEVVNRFVEDVEELFPSPHLLVSLIKHDTEELVPIYSRQLPHKAVQQIRSVPSQLKKWMRQGRDFIYYPTLSRVKSFTPELPEAKSALIVPLHVSGQLIGVLQAESHHTRPFSEEDIELLVMMAHQMSAKLRNVRLFEQTKRLERQQDAIIENAATLIGVADAKGNITIFNRALEEFTGYPREEVIGHGILEQMKKMFPRDQMKKIPALITKNEPFQNLTMDIKHKNSKMVKGRFNLSIQRDANDEIQQYILVGSDITEQDMLERQLVQTAKMAGLGRMAAGVAHELSNPVTYISTFAQLMNKDWEKRVANKKSDKVSKKDLEPIKKILHGVDRIETLLSNLMDYSRLDEGDLETINVNAVMKEALSFTDYEFKRGKIKVEHHLQEVPPVLGVKNQIQQVFINLLINASHALQKNGGGIITLQSGMEGEMVAIYVEDNGPGIPKNVIDQIFDPFFTTKPQGKGTGLGLSIVQDIINKHGGEISVKSKKGKGTTFTIKLPQAPEIYEGWGI